MLRLSHTVKVVKVTCSLNRGDVIMFIKTVAYHSCLLEGEQNKASKPSYTAIIQPSCKTTAHHDCSWNSYFRCNFLSFQSSHSQSLFLGKDQNVSHTFIRNKFPLRGIPAVSLFVSVISCLEVFFQLAPQKKKKLLRLLETCCCVSLVIVGNVTFSFKLANVCVFLKVLC